MSVISSPSCSAPWQSGFLAVLPTNQTHARFRFRHLRACSREEAVQGAIASACVSYQLLAAQERLHVACPSALARYAVGQVLSGRHVGGHQDSATDVLSLLAQRSRGIQVHSYDNASGEGEGWKGLVLADRKGLGGGPGGVPHRTLASNGE